MASSTTMPMARTSPNIERVFTEKPRTGKEDERPDEGHRHGDEGNDGRPQILEEDEDHQGDEDDRLDESVNDGLDRSLDRGRGVVDDGVVHVGGEELFRPFQRLVDRFRRHELVRPGEEIDRHRPRGLAVQPAEGVVVLRAQLHPSHVLDPDLGARRRLSNNDVLELLGGHETAGGAYRIGKLLVRGGWAHPHTSRRRLEVLLRTAPMTSAGVSPSFAIRSGRSQIRIP